MRAHRVYLLHPLETYLPGAAAWAAEVEALLRADEGWGEWDLVVTPYDDQNSFAVQPLFVRVLNKPGPVVLVEGVQRKALENLRGRLRTRAVVMVPAVGDSTDLWGAVAEARRRFESGEPFLPRKLVVAVMIVRKLRKGNYWAGKEKGYLWQDDLAKGRGVDERYADIAHVVANDLLQHEVLVFKTSQGTKKYALNPGRKPEAHAIADDGTFRNRKLEEILCRDTEELSAYLLNEPRAAQRFAIQGRGLKRFECAAAAEAVEHARGCPECDGYEV
ncbi:MAG: hypothetical protein C0501_30935 [Isosphaera sp.]|nr:hypothetical protein [Isosphaera sp.]